MAIFNFFNKSIQQLADMTARNVDNLISSRFAETNQYLRKIEAMHKETSIQLEEIDSNLQGDSDEAVYIGALIGLADIIEDFYYYYSSVYKDSPLFEQAQMMWNAAKNKAEEVGLTVIDSVDEPFNSYIHSIESTSYDYNLPVGYVIKILKCGYIFKGKIIRPAAVIINKQEINKQEIIYL